MVVLYQMGRVDLDKGRGRAEAGSASWYRKWMDGCHLNRDLVILYLKECFLGVHPRFHMS